MENKNLKELYNIIGDIVPILEDEYTFNAEYAITTFIKIKKFLHASNFTVDVGDFNAIKYDIKNMFQNNDGLAEFHIWREDFEERKNLNDIYESNIKELFLLLEKIY